MRRVGLILAAVALTSVLVGCGGIDTGRSQLLPAELMKGKTEPPKASETDIVEQLMNSRQTYRQSIEQLVQHYTDTGNNMKLNWAQKELAGLNAVPQYIYIIEAGVAGPDLRASTEIPEADLFYIEALGIEKKAKEMFFIVDENRLRIALQKYNQLIKKHPSSNKISDAAFRAGEIYEHFRDYSLALLYYKRAYQWAPDTSQPARFRAAFILDNKLHRRDEALELYQEAIKATKQGGQHETWVEYAQKRIDKLMGKEQTGK